MKSRKTDEMRIKEKRGEGRLRHYKPWFLVHEVSSRGISWRIKGKKTQRIHHLLSNLEKSVFLFLDRNPLVTDIREQFPLPLGRTLKIAATYNLRHGAYQGEVKTMTTDFLVDLPDRQIAISVKPWSNITKRFIEKLQIERQYWKTNGVELFLVTEKEITKLEIGV